jgi:hypothetical protein
MTLTLDQIPSNERPPARSTRSAVRAAIVSSAFSRRSLFRGIAAAGMGVGLASLDVLPGDLSRKAHAAPSTYWHCSAWLKDSTREWLKCNPGGSVNGNVGGSFCVPGGKYHRIDVVSGEHGIRTKFYRRHYSCTGNSGGRNAWRWRRNGRLPEPPPVFCSDGRGVVKNRYGTVVNRYKSACRRWL